MSKILVLGDIHGRTCWRDIIKREKDSDKVIFLGDYVSTHGLISETEQINNLEEILKYKENNPDKVILLRGNHCLESLGYDWAECYPYTGSIVKEYMKKNKDRFLRDTQWMYIMWDTIFVHAGITNTWLKNQNLEFGKLNTYPPSESFGFIPNRFSDYDGSSKTQSCVWVRPHYSITDAYGDGKYNYVVGHTTVQEIHDASLAGDYPKSFYMCDCLPKQYLLIENGEFIVKSYEESISEDR